MLKRLKLKFMVMASVMLVLIGFSSFDEARGQEVCPTVPFDTGWIRLGVTPSEDTNFTAGLLGTIESFGGATIGGLDWLYNDDSFLNTTMVGGQLISWWSQKGGRNTFLQVTNTDFLSGVSLHVQILDEGCNELKNFCDFLTPNDTHVYNLGDLVTNLGQNISERVLQGKEGIIVVTPVDACPDPNQAIAFNFLQGNLRMIDSSNDVDYGTNVYTRDSESECTDSGDLCTSDADCLPDDTCSPLDGRTGSFFDVFPSLLKHNFSIIGGVAAADLVLMSISDDYGPPYSAVAGFAGYSPDIFDDEENVESCTPFSGCFVRLGIDEPLPISEEFTPPPPPAEDCDDGVDNDGDGLVDCDDPNCVGDPACVVPVEDCDDTVDNDGDGLVDCDDTDCADDPACESPRRRGDGGGCAIAGDSVQTGTAIANVLLPLLPAFGIGLRVLRRRVKKSEK